MHGLYDPQIRQSSVRDFFFNEGFGNDADHLPAMPQHGVRHHSHKPDVAASIDEPVAALDKHARQLARRV